LDINTARVRFEPEVDIVPARRQGSFGAASAVD
jgi:hypothetical protein